jgi:hypothetical protein
MNAQQRYLLALSTLDAKISVTSNRDAANFLSRYLWGNPQGGMNPLYKYQTNHKSPAQRFRPPSETWRLQSRTDAIEALIKLPTPLLQALIIGGIEHGTSGRRSTITPHEMGDDICAEVHAAWEELRR